MMRNARNSFVAFQTAQGMENAGAVVFSISHDGMHQEFGARDPGSRFIVWAKVESDDMIAAVDEAIDKELGP